MHVDRFSFLPRSFRPYYEERITCVAGLAGVPPAMTLSS